MFEMVYQLIDFILHIDVHLTEILQAWGSLTYWILFAIVFAETGLIVFPLLPGDSLLFAAGALCALPESPLQIEWLCLGLIASAILGDFVNYSVGHWMGPKVFHSLDSKWLNRKHLLKAQAFYDKHGGMAIFFARFVPIVRTFAPFVAGVGKMKYSKFALFNVVGALVWVLSFTVAGYYFGNMPAIKSNFHWVILAILVLSVMPLVIEFLKSRHPKTSP